MFSPAFHTTLGSTLRPASPVETLPELVRRARSGEITAQDRLVGRYHARISGFIRSIIVDRVAVEDVAQIVFIKMTRRIRTLREVEVFEPWLFALARHAAYDHLRRRRRRPIFVELDAEPIDLPEPADARAVEEINELLDAALRHLRPVEQQLVRLVVAGHSYEVIAARTNLTPGGVRARLARLRPYLRAAIGGALGTHAGSSRTEARLARGWRTAA